MSRQPRWEHPDNSEKDPHWSAVDDYANSHLHSARDSRNPAPAVLESVLKRQSDEGLPNIAVSAAQGKFLSLLARAIRAERVLEVGTLGGYSTVWLASARKNIKVTTVEVDLRHAETARKSVDEAGVGEKVEIAVGAGLDVLPGLVKEVEEGKRGTFDLVFIDADKINGWNYFQLARSISRPGAVLIVDNVARRGRLADAEAAKTDRNVAGSRAVVENVGKLEGVEGTILQTVGEKNYDGLLITVLYDE
ncbi:S-adenosyl-L-methionine-dependent methyltransferase [Trichodelitschia bisporula]|uniref:S-adenosyl-L-methionine-dependent methyltransferase n=1 Tax=Trichodelitschia bisporula TaxID=703511 RepID=A0A6G1HLS8_9PEZI|nr:S-adenosyl-L-methionine-dependent methyltransferase [Trichodelitschia bisporula]